MFLLLSNFKFHVSEKREIYYNKHFENIPDFLKIQKFRKKLLT
jgi:hypothetical protein